MKITHYSNSFISVKSGNSTLVCDPWIGKADNNAWISYPIHKNGASIVNNLNPTFIYISHLHNDHFDPKLLKKIINKNKVKIVIKKFNNERLKNKIKELNFKNIIEILPWKKFKLNKDLCISIIPQETNNKDNIDTKINYDLDTSIIIQSTNTKKIFYNNVDNPLSTDDLKKLNIFVKEQYKSKINIACFPLGGASEYPQCFFKINKVKEKKRIIDNSVITVKTKLNILKPEVFFPAGGNYLIYGKFNHLNKFVSQPNNYHEIFKKLKRSTQKNCEIEGGNSMIYHNDEWIKISKKKYIKKNLIKEISKKYAKDLYGYEKIKIGNMNKLDSLFSLAKKKYLDIINNHYNGFNWRIKFHLYENLKINNKDKITKNSRKVREYIIDCVDPKKTQILDCHLDKNLFYCLITKKYNWNIALSGSLIMFERRPNKFFPDIPFSLNFLNC
tara:strand:+ start:932 stop:2263 length:1332 start_codon:yes stop_codon:yes gene_type:complete